MNELINKGIYFKNKVKQKKGPKTIVIMGVARSGTSMVAELLDSLGIFLGSKKDNVVFEDVEISGLLEQGNNIEEFKKLIEDRDNKYQNWGWKRPGAIHYADKFLKYLRNPLIIIPIRDPLAIAMRNSISVNADLENNLLDSYKKYEAVLDFIKNTNYPCFVFSYEKAITRKGDFIKSIIRLIGRKPTKELIDKARNTIKLNKPQYLNNTRTNRVFGVFDNYKNGIIKGWAIDNISEVPVTLNIHVDNTVIKTISANKFRGDLKANKIGTGSHSFVEDISNFLSDGKKHLISIKIASNNIELKNSPKEIIFNQAK